MLEHAINKKDIRDLVIVTLLIMVTFYVFKKNMNWHEVVGIVKGVHLRYLFLSFGLLFAFWALEAFMIGWLVHRVNVKIKKRYIPWLAIKTTLIGQYYANITPFASGGQPVQLFILKKNKLSTSEGTAVLVSKFLVFQITVTIYAFILFMVALKTTPAQTRPFVLFGLSLNLLGLAFIGFSAFKPNILYRPIEWIMYRFTASKVRMTKVKRKLKSFLDDYEVGMGRLTQNYGETLALFMLSILQLTAFFSMPYMLSKALGIEGLYYIQMLTIQAILYMAVSFIPIPGTVGVSEFGFIALVGNMMSHNLASSLMLLWRIVSYYFSLLFCGLFSLGVSIQERWQNKVKARQ